MEEVADDAGTTSTDRSGLFLDALFVLAMFFVALRGVDLLFSDDVGTVYAAGFWLVAASFAGSWVVTRWLVRAETDGVRGFAASVAVGVCTVLAFVLSIVSDGASALPVVGLSLVLAVTRFGWSVGVVHVAAVLVTSVVAQVVLGRGVVEILTVPVVSALADLFAVTFAWLLVEYDGQVRRSAARRRRGTQSGYRDRASTCRGTRQGSQGAARRARPPAHRDRHVTPVRPTDARTGRRPCVAGNRACREVGHRRARVHASLGPRSPSCPHRGTHRAGGTPCDRRELPRHRTHGAGAVGALTRRRRRRGRAVHPAVRSGRSHERVATRAQLDRDGRAPASRRHVASLRHRRGHRWRQRHRRRSSREPVVEGFGLRSLRERAEALGGTISATRSWRGFRLCAELPQPTETRP